MMNEFGSSDLASESGLFLSLPRKIWNRASIFGHPDSPWYAHLTHLVKLISLAG